MNYRLFLYRLSIVAATAMVMAALTYQGEVPSQVTANAPVPGLQQQ